MILGGFRSGGPRVPRGKGLSSSPSNTPPPFDRAAFPGVTVFDNVVCQHRLVREHLGIERLRLVVGYSMGAQQAFQWGALHSDTVDSIAPFCGTARTSPNNRLFLDNVRGHAGWAFSQDLFRDAEYRELGLGSVTRTICSPCSGPGGMGHQCQRPLRR
jgi:pimeloyl-ACP methyl ester carboxylesterase